MVCNIIIDVFNYNFYIFEVIMLKLVLFNCLLLFVIAALLVLVKRTVKTEMGRRITLLASATLTILFHYSTAIFRVVSGNAPFEYIADNPNLILPIYPCNVVMWACLILGLLRDKDSKLAQLLCDYIFYFGIFSTLVGMFANVDFIMNPTLRDYDITKSIVAHATLLFNVLLLPLFGRIEIDFSKNMKHMVSSVIGMYLIGLYCNLIFRVLVSAEAAYDVNSMFIIHSPFEGVGFLTYPIIAIVALFLYFCLFTVCELVKYPKGERWFDKALCLIKDKKG